MLQRKMFAAFFVAFCSPRLICLDGGAAEHTAPMAPKQKPVSQAGHITEHGNGFRARIKINGTYTNGRTHPTRELAQADLNAARAGATSHGDVAVALKKHLSSSSMVPSAAVLPEHAPEHAAGAGATAHEDVAAALTKEPSSSSF